MAKLLSIPVGILASLLSMLMTLFISIWALLGSLVGVPLAYYDFWLRLWSWVIIRSSGLTIRVQGSENLQHGQAYIMMMNHSSHLDIPLCFYVLRPYRTTLRMLTKKELFAIPVWGRAMRVSGFIPIDRKNREAAFRSLEEVRARLAQGVCIWIAPEGTRSRNGQIQEFKKGGFVTAIESGAPILPVYIHGLTKVLAKKHWYIHAFHTIDFQVGQPIPTAGLSLDEKDQLAETVRSWMLARQQEYASR